MSAPDPAARDRMIVEAMRTGMTREQASVLTDVSKHGFDQAMETIKRVVDTAPEELKLPVFASVLASLASILRDKLPEHWAAFAQSKHHTDEAAVIVLPDRQEGQADFGPGRWA